MLKIGLSCNLNPCPSTPRISILSAKSCCLSLGSQDDSFFFFFNVYLFGEGGRAEREGHRERETQNPKQAPDSKLSEQSLMQALDA